MKETKIAKEKQRPNLKQIIDDGFESNGKFLGHLEFYKKRLEIILYDPCNDEIKLRYDLEKFYSGFQEGDNLK